MRTIDEKTGEVLDEDGPGAYKLALKDMCMYRAIPQLIQAGVFSFKIEGRMRPAGFIRRIVSTYRKAIDAYIADPNGYTTDEEGWKNLYDNRARDFTTTFAFGQPGKKDIGFTGEREPRFFSHAVKEAGFQDEVLRQERDIEKENKPHRHLSVRVNTVESAKAAIDNGADTVYVGGEAFRPLRPWKLGDYAEILAYAKGKARVVVNTPRTTMRRECGEARAVLYGAPGHEAGRPDGQQPRLTQARKSYHRPAGAGGCVVQPLQPARGEVPAGERPLDGDDVVRAVVRAAARDRGEARRCRSRQSCTARMSR